MFPDTWRHQCLSSLSGLLAPWRSSSGQGPPSEGQGPPSSEGQGPRHGVLVPSAVASPAPAPRVRCCPEAPSPHAHALHLPGGRSLVPPQVTASGLGASGWEGCPSPWPRGVSVRPVFVHQLPASWSRPPAWALARVSPSLRGGASVDPTDQVRSSGATSPLLFPELVSVFFTPRLF